MSAQLQPAYVRLDSLQGYRLLEQDRIGATLPWREGGDWRWAEFSDPHAELTLPCTGLTVRLAELYEGTGLLEPSLETQGSS